MPEQDGVQETVGDGLDAEAQATWDRLNTPITDNPTAEALRLVAVQTVHSMRGDYTQKTQALASARRTHEEKVRADEEQLARERVAVDGLWEKVEKQAAEEPSEAEPAKVVGPSADMTAETKELKRQLAEQAQALNETKSTIQQMKVEKYQERQDAAIERLLDGHAEVPKATSVDPEDQKLREKLKGYVRLWFAAPAAPGETRRYDMAELAIVTKEVVNDFAVPRAKAKETKDPKDPKNKPTALPSSGKPRSEGGGGATRSPAATKPLPGSEEAHALHAKAMEEAIASAEE